MTTTAQINRDADERLALSTKEAARTLGLSHRTMEDWRGSGLGPRFVMLGSRVRYRVSDLIEYLDRNTFSSTGEALAA
ncbi:hypothetical protein BH10PSE2_BH10PSE2_11960 [soil metagenome]